MWVPIASEFSPPSCSSTFEKSIQNSEPLTQSQYPGWRIIPILSNRCFRFRKPYMTLTPLRPSIIKQIIPLFAEQTGSFAAVLDVMKGQEEDAGRRRIDVGCGKRTGGVTKRFAESVRMAMKGMVLKLRG
ncbi:uncharacterized protein BDR25DRAFT_350886 [Lindgomyces ingoldianus]|uniref:Uncharacterized protein n=1 Tax=Lindgomyces ingoldianus TaxID=673940 RepID=A0ACB6RAI6_9PLEO|nr:uncharacterized protein BDR25DRAFT_350886 [Lindgomyces ingoldianus]KAF2475542.1 hypothetical protein BDR25DRAFT_350886 [Lindgomyces ingoldianus]